MKFLPHVIAFVLLSFAFYEIKDLKEELRRLQITNVNNMSQMGELQIMMQGFVDQAPIEMRKIAREEVIKGFKEFAENFKNADDG